MELLQSIKSRTDQSWTPSLSRKTTAQIYWNMQKDRERINPDFKRIHESQLAKIFELYDTYFSKMKFPDCCEISIIRSAFGFRER